MKACRPPPPMPALAKQPSTRPKRSSVAAIAALTEAGSLTSQMRVSILPAPPAIDAAAFWFLPALRPQIEMSQPAAASACAMPRPMPPLPPVMTATRPVRSKMRASVSMRRFHLVWRALRLRPGAGRSPDTNHGQGRPENQIWGRANNPDTSAAPTTRTPPDEETMQFKHAPLDIDGPVAVLKLDHQEVMNAVSVDMLGGLGEALDTIDDKKAEVRCLVITGAGRALDRK